MDHGGEAARPTTTTGSSELGMAAAVQGSEASIGSGALDGSFSSVTGRGVVPVAAEFHLHQEPGPGGVAYHNVGPSWRQLGPVNVVLVVPQLPGGAVPVHDNYGNYSVLQPRPGAPRGVVLVDLLHGGGGEVSNWDYALHPHPGAGRGEVLVDLLPGDGGAVSNWDYALHPHPGAGRGEVLIDMLPGGGGAVSNWDYTLHPRPGAGRGEVLIDMLPDVAGHGQVFVGLLPGGVDAAYDNYGYYALQPRPGAAHGEVLVDQLPDDAGHDEVFVGLLPGGGAAAHDDYGYYPWQPRPDGEVLPDGVSVVFDGSGNIARQILPVAGTRGADGIAGALRGPNLGEGYDNRGVVAEHLRRLLPFAGIAASSVAVNGLAVSPGSPAVAFHLFVLLLGGLFLVILHVLRA